MVRYRLVSPQFGKCGEATAQVLDGKNGAVIGKIASQYRFAPDHQRSPLTGLLHNAPPGNAAIIADHGAGSDQGDGSAPEWQRDLTRKRIGGGPPLAHTVAPHRPPTL